MASNVNLFSLVSINIRVANFLNVLCNISIILKGRSKGRLMGSRVLEPCLYVISLTVRGFIFREGFTPTRRSSSSCLSRVATELQLMVQ